MNTHDDVERAEEEAHPPHAQRRRSALRGTVLLATVFTLGGISTACYVPAHDHPFLVCTRAHENDTYFDDDAGGVHHGAYQFKQSTWDSVVRGAGWDSLIGVDPHTVDAGTQDMVALRLYEQQGNGPWEGRC